MDSTRKQKLYADLDALAEELVTTPRMVRITIMKNTKFVYLLEGGLKFEPKYLHFNELPPFIAERIAILKMLNNYEEIPDIGKKFSDTVYHIPISIRVWESLIPSAVSQFI